MDFSKFANINSAIKRAKSMGKYHPSCSAYYEHPLAATIMNHVDCVEVEMAEQEPDFLACIVWIDHVCAKINVFCDGNKVSGNDASEYWLEYFLWMLGRYCVVDFELLRG